MAQQVHVDNAFCHQGQVGSGADVSIGYERNCDQQKKHNLVQ